MFVYNDHDNDDDDDIHKQYHYFQRYYHHYPVRYDNANTVVDMVDDTINDTSAADGCNTYGINGINGIGENINGINDMNWQGMRASPISVGFASQRSSPGLIYDLHNHNRNYCHNHNYHQRNANIIKTMTSSPSLVSSSMYKKQKLIRHMRCNKMHSNSQATTISSTTSSTTSSTRSGTHIPNPRKMSRNSRCLPCRAYLSTGTCPYQQDCHFVHDPRTTTYYHGIATPEIPASTLRLLCRDTSQDAFFWAPMEPDSTVSAATDGLNREYNLPSLLEYNANKEKQYAVRQLRTAECVYSMWWYFLHYLKRLQMEQQRFDHTSQHSSYRQLPCTLTSNSSGRKTSSAFPFEQAATLEDNSICLCNVVTRRKRLPIFISLSNR